MQLIKTEEEKVFFQQVYVTCEACGHKNLPHPKPIEGAKLILQGWNGPCRSCGRKLRVSSRMLLRPIFARARREMEWQALLDSAGTSKKHRKEKRCFLT